MGQIEWIPEMSVGHAELDEQHQMLLELYNRFDAASAQGKGSRETAALIEELQTYVHEHFAAEELVLEAANWEGRERHAKLHRQLENKLDAFRQEMAAGCRFTADFRKFLGYWWQNHIMDHDQDYGRALFGTASGGTGDHES